LDEKLNNGTSSEKHAVGRIYVSSHEEEGDEVYALMLRVVYVEIERVIALGKFIFLKLISVLIEEMVNEDWKSCNESGERDPDPAIYHIFLGVNRKVAKSKPSADGYF
jgi:hypothetical protein